MRSSAVVAQIVNFYLDPVNETHYDGLVKLSTRPASDKVDAEIRVSHFAHLASRVDFWTNCGFAGVLLRSYATRSSSHWTLTTSHC